MPTREKLNVIYSTMGRFPVIVEPIAIPANPNSEIGVSMTLLGPNSSNIPLDAL